VVKYVQRGYARMGACAVMKANIAYVLKGGLVLFVRSHNQLKSGNVNHHIVIVTVMVIATLQLEIASVQQDVLDQCVPTSFFQE